MLIKIPVEDLTKGMYVQELDRPWTETSFPFQAFAIRSEQELSELRRHCKHVFVQVDKSRLDPQGQRIVDAALRPHTRRSAIADIQFEPWDGAEKLNQTLRRLKKLQNVIDFEINNLYSEAAKKYSIDPARVHAIAAEIYRALEAEPRIGKWVAQMQTRSGGLAEHSRNVAVLAMGFARHLGFPEYLIMLVGEGALLHDIGLSRIPSRVIDRAGPLNLQERRLVQLHPTYARHCLESYLQLPVEIAEIVEFHHYRMDGSGYPEKLSPPPGRHVMAVAICDAFEAMTGYRNYKDPMAPEEALIELDRMSRRKFPAELVQQFIAYLGIYPRGNVVLLENGAIGVVVSCDANHKTRPVLRMVRGPGGNSSIGEEYIDLSRLDRDAYREGWRIVKSSHPSRLGLNPEQPPLKPAA